MTPEIIDSEIRSRWERVRKELIARKRLDSNVYAEVISALAHIPMSREYDEEYSG